MGSGLMDIYRLVSEIDVDKEGVKGAKNFFQAKVEIMYMSEEIIPKGHQLCLIYFLLSN